jgi:hypothetical protein
MTRDTKKSHGGKRTGAGRRPVPFSRFLKALRATDAERKEFASLLTGNARKDFVMLFDLLKSRTGKTLQQAADERRAYDRLNETFHR